MIFDNKSLVQLPGTCFTWHLRNYLTLCRYIGTLPVVALNMEDKDHKNVKELRRGVAISCFCMFRKAKAVCFCRIQAKKHKTKTKN